MFERMQCHTVAEQQACMQDERVFLGDFLQLDAGHAATVEYLQQVARVRMGLDRAADLLVHMLSAAATGTYVILDPVQLGTTSIGSFQVVCLYHSI